MADCCGNYRLGRFILMFIEVTEIVETNEAAGNTMCTPLRVNVHCIRHYYEQVGRCYLVLLPDLNCVPVVESYRQITDKLFLKGY